MGEEMGRGKQKRRRGRKILAAQEEREYFLVIPKKSRYCQVSPYRYDVREALKAPLI